MQVWPDIFYCWRILRHGNVDKREWRETLRISVKWWWRVFSILYLLSHAPRHPIALKKPSGKQQSTRFYSNLQIRSKEELLSIFLLFCYSWMNDLLEICALSIPSSFLQLLSTLQPTEKMPNVENQKFISSGSCSAHSPEFMLFPSSFSMINLHTNRVVCHRSEWLFSKVGAPLCKLCVSSSSLLINILHDSICLVITARWFRFLWILLISCYLQHLVLVVGMYARCRHKYPWICMVCYVKPVPTISTKNTLKVSQCQDKKQIPKSHWEKDYIKYHIRILLIY